MSKATRATLSNLGAGVAVSAFHALVSARTPLTMTGTLSQSARSQGQGSMSTFKADSAFMLRPRSPRPFSAISPGFVVHATALRLNLTIFCVPDYFLVFLQFLIFLNSCCKKRVCLLLALSFWNVELYLYFCNVTMYAFVIMIRFLLIDVADIEQITVLWDSQRPSFDNIQMKGFWRGSGCESCTR